MSGALFGFAAGLLVGLGLGEAIERRRARSRYRERLARSAEALAAAQRTGWRDGRVDLRGAGR